MHKNMDIFNIQLETLTKTSVEIKEKIANIVTTSELNDIRASLRGKCDKADLAQLYDIKSNKTDIENLISSIDLVHKQIE